MKTAVMKLKDIRPAAYNPRVTLKPGDKDYEALKNSLERFGVAEPLIVNETTGNLVAGHQRLKCTESERRNGGRSGSRGNGRGQRKAPQYRPEQD